MTDLLELAERAEKATGPDREIDGWAWAHLKAGEPYIIGHKEGRFPQEAIYGERLDAMRMVGGKDAADYIGAPLFTASLDAAKSLKHPGDLWCVGSMEDGPFARVVPAIPDGTFGSEIFVQAETAEGALVSAFLRAAALRARHAEIEERVDG